MKRALLTFCIAVAAISLLAFYGCATHKQAASAPMEAAEVAQPVPVMPPAQTAPAMSPPPSPAPPSSSAYTLPPAATPAPQVPAALAAESYAGFEENPFLASQDAPYSTFSIDVDTASYANVRRLINLGQVPPRDAVRIEELINYFTYGYAPPANDDPFAVRVDVASCPWNKENRLVRVGLKGKEFDDSQRPAANLVFLIDVSGSMEDVQKLPLLKSALRLLVDRLQPRDRVGIVTYSGTSSVALRPVSCDEGGKKQLLRAIEELNASGTTAGSAGIQQAYDLAEDRYRERRSNRVILCTDGDFNVGITDLEQLTRLIEEKAQSGVFLTVLGFGMGNLKDSTLEKLADKGNGHYAYIDTLNEARKALVEEASGTLVTIAKDVKIQVEFNPTKVGAYRLIGYENRMLQDKDFNDDKKDAGDIGAGHTVTALYEIAPEGSKLAAGEDKPNVDPMVFRKPTELSPEAFGNELLAVKLRYKRPNEDESRLIAQRAFDAACQMKDADADFRFAAAVAEFGMLLRGSEHKGAATYDDAIALAESARGDDPGGYRAEFIALARNAKVLAPAKPEK